MKRKFISIAFALLAGFFFAGCSNLFENLINDDLSFKNGDDSLLENNAVIENENPNENSIINSGLVVIKQTRPQKNQIKYSKEQNVYFVGNLPTDFTDEDLQEIYGTNAIPSDIYTGGSNINLVGIDNPVELRCFPNDKNAKVRWNLVQIWHYASDEDSTNGYSIKKLKNPNNINYDIEEKESKSSIKTDLPYGVTVATCTVFADDNQFSTEYKIVFTKKYTPVFVDNKNSENPIIDTGLVVLSAQAPEVNQITFNPEIYEYKDISVCADDNDMKFRCYLSDADATIDWNIVQTVKYEPVLKTYSKEITDKFLGKTETVSYKYISKINEIPCNKENPENSVDFEPTDNTDLSANEIKATIPYGITEVSATISYDNQKTTVYKIILKREISAKPQTESEFAASLKTGNAEGAYSKLKDLNLEVLNGENKSTPTFEPEFSPEHTIYTLTVDEEADSLVINAIAASEKAKISDPKVITKYGEVPATNGYNINLVGGKTRITFTVTDETNIPRLYTIYVEKPEDGDTTLEAINYTPENGYENGVKGFTVDNTFKGYSNNLDKKYSMTLSADSRIDVSEVNFTAVPNKKRTQVSYAISDSNTTVPDTWSESFTKANVKSQNITFEDSDVPNITKYLWIKTVSDAYFHTTNNGYESKKRSDTTYHIVQITKAGNANQKLTELVAVVTFEDGTSESYNIITDQTKEVAHIVKEYTKKVTTFADKIDFYFRPLDKDATVTYSAKNTKFDSKIENTSFAGYTTETKLEKVSGRCTLLNNDSEYYHFAIGEVQEGTDATLALPKGTTEVKICGTTFTFIKPDLTNVNYSLNLNPDKNQNAELKWSKYIYINNASLRMNLISEQQNQIITVNSCEHTHDINGTEIEATAKSNDVTAVITRNEGNANNLTSWTANVSNLPAGTTTLTITVTNEKATKDYVYYIVRAAESETRLKTLTFDGKTPTQFETNWNNGNTNTTCTSLHNETLKINAGKKKLYVEAVNPQAKITIERRHSEVSNIQESNDSRWENAESELVKTGNGNVTVSYSFEEKDAVKNAGSIMYTINVYASENDTVPSHIYYLIIHVEADKKAQLDALKIIQEGKTESRTILANSFKPGTFDYTNLSASLNYTGDIVITPTKWKYAKITNVTIMIDNVRILDYENYIFENEIIKIPYNEYSQNLGRTYKVSYTIQAQDTTVKPVTYTAQIKIPTLDIVEKAAQKQTVNSYDYTVPAKVKGLGYRFGSVIADETVLAKGFFGGIDIIGTTDGNTWYESSFGGSGLQFVLSIEENNSYKNYWVKLNNNGKLEKLYAYSNTTGAKEVAIPAGIEFKVVPNFVKIEDELYLELCTTLKNSSGKKVKLGATIDTLIGTIKDSTIAANDSVNVTNTENGFVMSGNGYKFTVFLQNAYKVYDVTDFWYGDYNGAKFLENVFTTNTSKNCKSSKDSAASFYWDIGNQTLSTKFIRISMGK